MPRRLLTDRSLATRLLGLQLVVVAVVVAVGAVVALLTARDRTYDQHRDETRAIARILAIDPTVPRALTRPDPTRTLQPLVERMRRGSGMSFITVMRPDRTRITHPTASLIGKPFVGRIAPALAGREFTERYRGTLGPSVRTVAPLRDASGRIVGLVAVGVTLDRIGALAGKQVPGLLLLALATFAIGGTLSLLLARRIKRQTLGLEPERITALYRHHDATLHAIGEGVLVSDAEGRLTLVNDEARGLLGLPADAEGRRVADLGLPAGAADLLTSDGTIRDATLAVGGRVLVVSRTPTVVGGRRTGDVTVLRDRTELEALGRELDAVRGMTDALRAQAHEAAYRMHTIVGLVELGRADEAVRFGSDEAAFASDLLRDLEARIDEPALVALVLGKVAVARERGVALRVDEDGRVPATGIPAADLVTIVGNLLDNAIDAAADGADGGGTVSDGADDHRTPSHATGAASGARGHVGLVLGVVDGELVIEVDDDGAGLPAGDHDRLFAAGFSTKRSGPGGRGVGLALVAGAAERLGGTVAAEPRPGGGALVRALLPVRHAAPDGAGAR
ncbi:ATP-binding protein [Patulibacter minatonensis]|uniref:ATP-binding protein n=1 Tax=Patulibacter minatonensis TaxID=298163 RepID=UPI00047B4A51|nr:sensor histidine kinase [Patulibacter minatonensis]